jgi:hypothetical protein
MATQKYRSRLDATVGENEGTTRPVHPARPELPVKAGAENKTPPPTKRADYSMDEKVFVPGYGKNHDSNPSSILPGETVNAPFSAMAPKDDVLTGLQHGGTRALDRGDDWQTRKLDPGNVPTHSNMRDANAGGSPSGKVPAKCGASEFNPTSIRKPGA